MPAPVPMSAILPSRTEACVAVGVRAPGRLHLGFLDPSGSLGRRFGSIGIACKDRLNDCTMLLQRVDVVTGGASAVYGSDALAGSCAGSPRVPANGKIAWPTAWNPSDRSRVASLFVRTTFIFAVSYASSAVSRVRRTSSRKPAHHARSL